MSVGNLNLRNFIVPIRIQVRKLFEVKGGTDIGDEVKV